MCKSWVDNISVHVIRICLQKEETVLRTGLDEMFGNLNTDTLRSMRRTMTVQRTKMEWNVYDVRMKKQMRK